MPEEFDVFLSHNSRDKPVVEDIAEHLRGQGLRVWLDKWELRPGFPWQEGLEEGVQASRAVAVFVGADGLGDWQEPEMRASLARSRKERIPVIPVLLPGCPDSPRLSLFLEALTWVDLRGGLSDAGLARLVWGITGQKTEIANGDGKRPGLFRRRNAPRSWWSWGIGLLLLGVIVSVAAWLWPRSPTPPLPPERPQIYAVRAQVLDPQGHPVAGATVRASAGNEPQQTPDGWWEVEIPAAKVPVNGRVSLWAEHPEWEGGAVDLRLGEDPNPRAAIRLKEPETWLRGQVVNASGQPVAGGRVFRQGAMSAVALTDDQGHFELKLPVPPEMRVRLRAEHRQASGETFCYAGRDTCSIVLEEL